MIVIENLTQTPTVGKGLLECLLPHCCHYLQDLLLAGAELHLPTTTLGRTPEIRLDDWLPSLVV